MTLVLKILFTVFALIIFSIKIHATNYYINESDFFTFYPNPAKQNVVINVNAMQNQKIDISIYNLRGQLIGSDSFLTVTGGLNSFKFLVHHISNGIFILNVSN